MEYSVLLICLIVSSWCYLTCFCIPFISVNCSGGWIRFEQNILSKSILQVMLVPPDCISLGGQVTLRACTLTCQSISQPGRGGWGRARESLLTIRKIQPEEFLTDGCQWVGKMEKSMRKNRIRERRDRRPCHQGAFGLL